MDLDCLSENMAISSLSDHQKLVNMLAQRQIIIFPKKKKTQLLTDFWLLGNLEIDTLCDKQSRFIKTYENF